MTKYEYLAPDQYPEQIEVYRFDVDTRVESGIQTARTMLAKDLGIPAMHGFFDLDVTCHLGSNFISRLNRPSGSLAGIGSPFVSVSFKPSRLMRDGMERRGEIETSSLFLMTIQRERIIVPTEYRLPNMEYWQKYAFEVLIVGDVDKESIYRIGPARDYFYE